MKNYYSKLKLILSLLIVFSFTVTNGLAQVGTHFFPIGGLTTWSTDAFTNLNFIGNVPANSPPAQIATTFNGLTITGVTADPTPQAINDFTGLKLMFDAYISSDGSKNTSIVLGSNAVWGGEGIVIEINKFSVTGVTNFNYEQDANINPTAAKYLVTDFTAYQNTIVRQDQYNKFIIDVDAAGKITVTVNGIVLGNTYDASLAILKANGNRFALFATGFSGFQVKNIKAEKGGTIRSFFTSEFNTRYAETATDWTLSATNELMYNGFVPFTTPAVVETTFGGLTTPTATSNNFTDLTLTFDAYISSLGANTTVVLSSNGIWENGPLGVAGPGRGTVLYINKDEISAALNYLTPTTLSTNATSYRNVVNADAYNNFIISVAADSKITITVNGYVLPTVFQGGTLTAAAPNPRYAVFAAGFSGFKMRNLTAVKGGVSKSYFFNTLPVTLTKFEASKKSNGSQLNWETASEQNNSHYLISRSTDGSNFQQIAKIDGKNEAATYNYLDASPTSGNNYYKLVQVDFDGTAKDLGVRVVNFDLKTDNTVSIYPKPADKSINLSFNRTLEDAITVKLFDLSGKELQRTTIPSQNAPLNYVLDFNSRIIPGVYIINLSAGSFNHSERIIVK